MKQVDKLTDCGSERALIATIIKGGKDSLIDCSDIVQPTDFSLPINKTIYLCLQQLAEDPHCESFDIESIKLKAKTLGLAEHLSSKKDIEYLEFLKANSFDKKNIQLFALQIKKLSIARDLYSRYTDALNYLGNISGQETLSDIIKECESRIIDFVNGVDQGASLELLSENLEAYVDEILAREVVDQIGLPSNFPLWDEAIGGGFRRGTVTVVGARPKCVRSDNTFIPTTKGMLSLVELHSNKEKEEEIDYQVLNRNGALSIPKIWFNVGISKTLKIKTMYGYELEVTPDHPLMILNKDGDFEWIEAKDLAPEHYLILRRGDNIWGTNSIDLDDAYIYGCLVGDGYVQKRNINNVNLTTPDKDIVDKFYDFAAKYQFDITVSTKTDEDGTLNKASAYALVNNVETRKMLFDQYDFYTENRECKVIPVFIRQLNKSGICAFLRGLFDTDGCVENKEIVSFSSKGELLSIQVQTMLLNLGILCSRRAKWVKIPEKNERRLYYIITINNVLDVIKFKEEIGFNVTYKKELLEIACTRKSIPKNDVVPHCDRLLGILKTKYIQKHKKISLHKKDYFIDNLNKWIKKERRMARPSIALVLNRFKDLKDEPEYKRLASLYSYNYLFVQPEEISNSESITSDYHIPDTHSFISNGFISHNCGKSFSALNKALNVAKKKIPVIYLDSELTEISQKNRLICISSGCSIYEFETGKFKYSNDSVKKVVEASRELENIPLYYESIGGISPSETLSLVRRWIVKHVGFNEEGKANDCLIVYDYLKLVSGEALAKHSPEYIILGLMLTEMHNFSVKYDVPFLTYVQLNRDGIDQEDTSIVAGSDRILWLCSSLSILKNKNEDDAAMGCGWEHGNKCLKVLETRYGPGLQDGDYINIHASIRPNVGKEASGKFREGFLFSQVRTAPIMTNDNQPRDNSGDQRKGK